MKDSVQVSLFEEYDGIGTDAAMLRLDAARQKFFTRQEAADVLGISVDLVRWAIDDMRLDCLRIARVYRIPRTAVEDFIIDPPPANAIAALDEYLRGREVSGAIAAATDLRMGVATREEIFRSFPFSVGPELRNAILDADPHRWNKHAGIAEKNLRDWYALARLELPESADVATWAAVLRMPVDILKDASGWISGGSIGKRTFLRFLIGCELVNIPVFSWDSQKPRTKASSAGSESRQLLLFSDRT